MSEVSDKVMQYMAPIIENLGFELADVTYTKQFDGMELNLSICKTDGNVSIEDCELVSRSLDEPLEQLNPTNDKPYNLVVGSLGLDRPMIQTKDFVRNIGKEVEIKLYKPINKEKQLIGILLDVNDQAIALEVKKEKLTLTRDQIASAKLYIKF